MASYHWSPVKSLGFTLMFSFDGDGEEEAEQCVYAVHACTWVCADMHAGVCAPVWGPEVNLGYLLLLLTLFLTNPGDH